MRAATAVVLLPGIVSRRPAVHAAQAVTLVIMMIVAVSSIAQPVG